MFILKSKYKFSLGVLVIYCGGMEKPILFLFTSFTGINNLSYSTTFYKRNFSKTFL